MSPRRADLPLAGVRIVDFTLFWAGPFPTALLADLGAEVIKIESIQRPDPFRAYGVPGDASKDRAWERSPLFNAANKNKLGLTLNLAAEEGRALFRRLVAVSDAVLTNYTPRVLPQFELGFEKLREVNPKIVLASVSGMGQDGPWRDYVSFAAIGEALSGVSSLTGYTGEGAIIHGVGGSDPFAGLAAAFTLLAAVREARMSGCGRHVDVSQIEATLPLLADAFLDWSLNGHRRERTTNDHPSRAPHGAFPTRGDDQWIAISVGTDDEWWALAEFAGRADWAIDERFRTPALRHRNRHELRDAVADWTRLVDKNEAAAALRLRGVPAAPVRSPAEQVEDPRLRASGFLQWVDHEVAGRHPYPSYPARIDGEHPPIERVGPLLGEDNRSVLKEILGLDDAEIARLEEAKVIGTEPITGG